MSGSHAYAAALDLLKVRDRSEAELASRLRRKGFADAEVAAALERCHELGYLDDLRFAENRARTLARLGRAVGPKIAADLRRRGISATIVQETLRRIGEEFDERVLLAELFRQKFPDFRWIDAEDREKRRLVGFFQRRGFSTSLILDTLKHIED